VQGEALPQTRFHTIPLPDAPPTKRSFPRASVSVPLNASGRIAFAPNLARRAADLEDLEPWPGREPDFASPRPVAGGASLGE